HKSRRSEWLSDIFKSAGKRQTAKALVVWPPDIQVCPESTSQKSSGSTTYGSSQLADCQAGLARPRLTLAKERGAGDLRLELMLSPRGTLRRIHEAGLWRITLGSGQFVVRFERGQHGFGAFEDRFGKSGQAGDMDAVALVRVPRADLVEEYDFILKLAYL